MRFVFVHAEKALCPVRVFCSVLGVSRSGYDAWIDRPMAARTQADEELVVEIVAAHRRSRATSGSPCVHSELRSRGARVGRKRIERLMPARPTSIVSPRANAAPVSIDVTTTSPSPPR